MQLSLGISFLSATVEVELEKKKTSELRTFELDQALKKPKTTVVELRAFERCTFFIVEII
jgi:hypothetical protein